MNGHRQVEAAKEPHAERGTDGEVELHNLPLVIHVRCKKRTDTGELVNEIKGYAKKDTPAPAASAATTSDNTPPWKRS